MTISKYPQLQIIPANPAGNKTIFVTTTVDREDYQEVASYLLSLEEYEAEQVAFILEDGSMEMCGMEFCGNASRTFALIKAKGLCGSESTDRNEAVENSGSSNVGGIANEQLIEIKVSGCDEPLQVLVNTETNYTKIEMPIPLSVKSIGSIVKCDNIDMENTMHDDDVLVDLGGIMHLVTTSKKADPNVFQRLKNRIMSEFKPPAMGVMFYEPESSRLTPVVYVADVDSTYFEGSCASGTVAVAAALAMGNADCLKDGNAGSVNNFGNEGNLDNEGKPDNENCQEFKFDIYQPKGQLTAAIKKRQGSFESVSIEGSVELGDPVTIRMPEYK